MKGVVLESYGKPLVYGEIPDPVPVESGVVIRVRAAGLCRSDWHGWQGHDDDIQSLPHVLGHEFAGEIVEIGGEVRSLEVGQRVTVPFACGCGVCPQCLDGDAQVCTDQYQPGVHGAGAFAELVAIPRADFNVVPLPDSVGYVEAASLGCRFATSFRALANADQAAVQPGEVVVIFGCGGVGLSAVMIAKALGATVVAIDIRSDALEAARAMGADAVSLSDAAEDLVFNLTEGQGAHVTVDALGSAQVCREAIKFLRPKGRHCQIGLLLGKDTDPSMPMGRVIANELRIIGSHGMSAARYPEMLEMVASGKLQPEKLVGDKISLSEIPSAMEALGNFNAGTGISVAEC